MFIIAEHILLFTTSVATRCNLLRYECMVAPWIETISDVCCQKYSTLVLTKEKLQFLMFFCFVF